MGAVAPVAYCCVQLELRRDGGGAECTAYEQRKKKDQGIGVDVEHRSRGVVASVGGLMVFGGREWLGGNSIPKLCVG